ncbi:hypothetical protein [Streptomyces sp. BE303]|uniref:hypothetical protein n=1 Tax=Streptomycetaceae TaxID=2062 RepID=UPI002E773606|nr:hypothetical protein [Streptomyces sp. BE303]MED7949990.1 hypothetical protein [Streptomyces sp. BE303]
MSKPAVSVLAALLVALVPCAALTPAGGPDRGACTVGFFAGDPLVTARPVAPVADVPGCPAAVERGL